MDPFAKLRDALKQANPTITVSVRRCRVPNGLCGDCLRMDGYFRIRINPSYSLQVQLDSLVHEFAHAIAHIEWENTWDHGPEFGMAYAECYRIYEKAACSQ
jgi:hypothetical protein